jgi:hypothetical protein
MANATRTDDDPRQLRLPFEEGPRWDGAGLEAALAGAGDHPVRLTLTDNRSVLLSVRRQREQVLVRLHHMFLHAPAEVVAALGRALQRGRRRVTPGEVRRFMNANMHRVRQRRRVLPPLSSVGRVYDLGAVFARLNAEHFGGALDVPLTWGRGTGRARRGGITFGSYDPVLRLIRIHPVLDREQVPLYFLESVVYHEMLHHHMGGVADRAGRTVYHTRAFRAAEQRFPGHAQALAWEKQNLAYLLRASQALERRRRAEAARRSA